MYPQIRNSVKAILIDAGKILVVCRRDSRGDYYMLPGGGQKYGETLLETLSRECYEEVGVEILALELCFVRDYISKRDPDTAVSADTHQVEFLFRGRIISGTPGSGTHPDASQFDVRWIALAELPKLRFYPTELLPWLQTGLVGPHPLYLPQQSGTI